MNEQTAQEAPESIEGSNRTPPPRSVESRPVLWDWMSAEYTDWLYIADMPTEELARRIRERTEIGTIQK